MRIAVLDLGTNTFNLLIAEKSGNHAISIRHNSKIPVKLGEGGINRGEIIAPAYQRGIDAIRSHYNTIKEHEVDAIKAFGTSALRTANNGTRFRKEAYSILGTPIEIISGEREAELIYFGVRQTYNMGAEKCLILDIGGGSNEFIIADMQNIYWKKSYKLGIARLLELFKPSDPITPDQIKAIQKHIVAETTDLLEMARKYKVNKLLGASGSFETFEAMIHAEEDFVSESAMEARAIEISQRDFDALYRKLIGSTVEERKKMPGLEAMRIEMIVLAALFVKFIGPMLGISLMIQTNFALKEGAAFEMLTR